jgi:hypothetical protein
MGNVGLLIQALDSKKVAILRFHLYLPSGTLRLLVLNLPRFLRSRSEYPCRGDCRLVFGYEINDTSSRKLKDVSLA